MIAPRLLVVADLGFVGDTARWVALLHEVAEAAEGKPVAIQVRAKDVAAPELAELARIAREAVPQGVPLFLNGPEELAEELRYDGVHWPEAAIPGESSPRPSRFAGDDEASPRPSPLRRERPATWRSAAVHGIEGLGRAERAGADFVVFGSVFAPGSKAGEAVGLDALRDVTRAAGVPVIAIGGVTPQRVAECVDAGAAGVAVVSGVLAASSASAAVRAYLEALAAADIAATGGER